MGLPPSQDGRVVYPPFLRGWTRSPPGERVHRSGSALWGDVWPPFGGVSFTDIGKIVDAFKSLLFIPGDPSGGAPRKVRAMLRVNSAPLDTPINFTDIGNVVNAFKTIAYAEDGPTACP